MEKCAIAQHLPYLSALPFLFLLWASQLRAVRFQRGIIILGTLVQWEKNPGDFVELDDVVAVIETDKV